ncbi:MAG: carbohydrate kinase family protein [Chloroflexota bacterium]|nr:carbohydrate kinase family protein [Chloroflexota bacterium]
MPEVGCMGILVADTFCGPLDALPKPGELLAIDALPVSVGGCASNVAIGIARQGHSVDAVGCLGQDAAADVVRAALTSAGVGCQHIITSAALPTSQTIVLLVKGDDRRFIHLFGANAELSIDQVDLDWVRTLKVLYVGGLYVLPGINNSALAELFAYCRVHGVKTVLDVVLPQQINDFSGLRAILPHVDYFLPNDDEASRIAGTTSIAEQAAHLLAWGAQTVVITQGGRGADAARGQDRWHIAPYPMEVIDTTGGGDAFAAGFIAGLLRGWDLPDMLRAGAALGASAVRAIGTTTGVFTADELRAFMAAHTPEITHHTG